MAGVEPQAVPKNRAAHLAVVVLQFRELVHARGIALRLQLGRDVGALEIARLIVGGSESAQRVAPRLHDEVHRQPGVHRIGAFRRRRDCLLPLASAFRNRHLSPQSGRVIHDRSDRSSDCLRISKGEESEYDFAIRHSLEKFVLRQSRTNETLVFPIVLLIRRNFPNSVK